MIEAHEQYIADLYLWAQQMSPMAFRSHAAKQLASVVEADAVVWASGPIQTRRFPSIACYGVAESFIQCLSYYAAENPLLKWLIQNPGQAMDMSDVISDEAFLKSVIYRECFQPYGFRRVLSSLHFEPNSNVCTLLSVYRKQKSFEPETRQSQQRFLFHLRRAEQNCLENYFSKKKKSSQGWSYALVDECGTLYYAQQNWLNQVAACLKNADQSANNLSQKVSHCPLDWIERGTTEAALNKEWFVSNDRVLKFTHESENLYVVSMRSANALDKLSVREQEVADLIYKGFTMKQVANSLSLSPSTVASHLQSIYTKLKIHSKQALLKIMALNQN